MGPAPDAGRPAMDDRPRTPRTLFVADHLWDALATMAAEMGAEREALVNQALYTFARLNGFVFPADLRRLAASYPVRAAASSPSSRGRPTPPMIADHPLRPAANPERVAELERQLGVAANGRGVSPVEVDEELLGGGPATNMELPNLAEMGLSRPGRAAAPMVSRAVPPDPPEVTPSPPGKVLVLLADGRELDRVVKDRFLIGRGKHCDLIINSGKVSREHAAIVRDGGAWFIEDLGSSNGTWFDKRRIGRRQIQDGDDYYICAEKLSCAFR